MTTVLTAIQTAAKRCGINYTLSTAVGNVDNNVIALLAKMEETGKAIREFADWPELQKETSFNLSEDQANYALNADFLRMIDETQFNRGQTWPVYGPINPSSWQYLKSGIISLQVNQRYRIKGWVDSQFFLDSTPTDDNETDDIYYEYISKTWIRPKTWVALTSWSGISYCSYNGNIYSKASGTTTGSTAPTHTSGTVSDGGIDWAYSSAAYETFIHDTDQLILSDEDIIQGTVWRWKMDNGFAFEPYAGEAQARLIRRKSDLNGASTLDWGNASDSYLYLDAKNFPESDYGS